MYDSIFKGYDNFCELEGEIDHTTDTLVVSVDFLDPEPHEVNSKFLPATKWGDYYNDARDYNRETSPVKKVMHAGNGMTRPLALPNSSGDANFDDPMGILYKDSPIKTLAQALDEEFLDDGSKRDVLSQIRSKGLLGAFSGKEGGKSLESLPQFNNDFSKQSILNSMQKRKLGDESARGKMELRDGGFMELGRLSSDLQTRLDSLKEQVGLKPPRPAFDLRTGHPIGDHYTFGTGAELST